jgi:hypothetical protein
MPGIARHHQHISFETLPYAGMHLSRYENSFSKKDYFGLFS